MAKTKDERFEQLGTKIDPAMAEVLNACCDAMGVDVYHLLQWFAYTIVKASAPMHNLDPRIQKLMTMLDRDAGWQNAFNLCNPDKLKVAQVVLILEQDNHKGFGAVMVDKPFFSKRSETECLQLLHQSWCVWWWRWRWLGSYHAFVIRYHVASPPSH